MDDVAARKRLDAKMNEGRVALRLKWVEVAQRARMSVQNLSLIRKGDITITELAAANLEDALEWAPGSVAAILAGREPTLRARPDEVGAILTYIEDRWGPEAAREVLAATRRERGRDSGESQADYQAKRRGTGTTPNE